MRAGTIWDLIKDDWYGHRWMILSCLFIPLLLEMLMMWQGAFIYGWFQDILDVDKMTVTVVFGLLCVFIPYTLLWIYAVSRLSSEADAGFYRFARMLPVKAEEVVTARVISSFVLSVGGLLWFALLLGVFTPGLGQPIEPGLWTVLYLNAFFFPVSLAVYHGLFFRSGTKGTTGSVVFLFFLLIMWGRRGGLAKRGVQTFDSMLHDYPMITVGIGAVILIVIWLLCWCWAMTAYRKYLEGTLRSAKKRRTRRATE
ncbi:ABC-2 transporter permease [Lentibacillus daqui]|uniref:ABC-2 transporter permease n=1 Tax=Lentibacillus daqui TaxID=2911514 RepID=UPI0022B0F7FD|nr:ABC-2 transporter permease [Lentibacillus daqui]